MYWYKDANKREKLHRKGRYKEVFETVFVFSAEPAPAPLLDHECGVITSIFTIIDEFLINAPKSIWTGASSQHALPDKQFNCEISGTISTKGGIGDNFQHWHDDHTKTDTPRQLWSYTP